VTGLLEVRVLQPADAERAEAGGADRVELVSQQGTGELSPEPALVGQVRRATALPLRVLLRLRPGYSTDGGELARLQGLLSAYRAVGADGVVLGFLNAHTEIDVPVVTEVMGDGSALQQAQDRASGERWGWTFDRAVDSCMSLDRAWRVLRQLPGLDQVLTAGSARGVSEGLDELVHRAETDAFARSTIMAGGDLLAEHVPWLVRAGVRAFHLDQAVRPGGSWKAYVDADLVRTWRTLIDSTVERDLSRAGRD
jgi:copper homeostasis protein